MTVDAWFRELGWQIAAEGKQDFVLFDKRDDLIFQVVLETRQLTDEQVMRASATASSEEFSRLGKLIMGIGADIRSLCIAQLQHYAPTLSRDDAVQVDAALREWWKKQDIPAAIKAFAEAPGDSAVSQGNHLTALAYLGDFTTLMDYQTMFRDGQRMNFLPMIKPEMIDRALDIALERG